MADVVTVHAGDWTQASFIKSGFRAKRPGLFEGWETVGFEDLADLTAGTSDPSTRVRGRSGGSTFTLIHKDGRKLFCSASPSHFHAIQTAYTAYRINLERGVKPKSAAATNLISSAVIGAGCLALLALCSSPSTSPRVGASVTREEGNKLPGAGESTASSSDVKVTSAKAVSASPPPSPKETDLADDETTQAIVVQSAKDALTASLRDPDSVIFKDVAFHHNRSKTFAVCGWFNSKNGFGGYSGFEAFVSNGTEEMTIVQSAVKFSTFRKVWTKLCEG